MTRQELKIVSGGQTGVDQGALEAAVDLGVGWGGWVPKGWRAENGTVPERFRARISSLRSARRMPSARCASGSGSSLSPLIPCRSSSTSPARAKAKRLASSLVPASFSPRY